MAVLFLIVFMDLVGFGLLIPLLPFMVERLGAGTAVITIVLGLYSLAQFVAGPGWGRLSDRYGRKPILVITSFGLAASYLLLGVADTLPLIVAARIFGGVMAGNIGAAQAYVSDITTPETRAKGMGLVGAAIGLGFIFGPAIGGVLGGESVETANFLLPASVAAAITVAAAVGALLFLKESLPAHLRHAPAGTDVRPWRARLTAALGRRSLVMLIVTGFLSLTAWAQFESIFALWANAQLAYGPRQIGFLLTLLGLIGALLQGGAIGLLTRRFGHRRLVLTSLVLQAAGYGVIAAAEALPLVLGACVLLAAGSSLFNPSVASLVSQQAAPHERGAILGTYQAASALGRVVGPAFAGLVFALGGSAAPFLVSMALIAPALLLMLRLPQHEAG
jgi:MFS family permease